MPPEIPLKNKMYCFYYHCCQCLQSQISCRVAGRSEEGKTAEIRCCWFFTCQAPNEFTRHWRAPVDGEPNVHEIRGWLGWRRRTNMRWQRRLPRYSWNWVRRKPVPLDWAVRDELNVCKTKQLHDGNQVGWFVALAKVWFIYAVSCWCNASNRWRAKPENTFVSTACKAAFYAVLQDEYLKSDLPANSQRGSKTLTFTR